MGEYKWFSLVLAEFNPVEADKIFNLPADQIAEAYVSQRAANYVKPSK